MNQTTTVDYDVLVVGGGINGCGIARDLAGRGLRVVLCEQHDLAAHTSSASSKLVHGGLRYLEFGEFALVRKALRERERLLRAAPHIAYPLRFVLPHDRVLRPLPLMCAGLWLYDHLARRGGLDSSRLIDLRRHAAGAALRPQWHRGFLYSDGWVDDARLVVLNAIDAAQRGADIRPRTRVEELQRRSDHWQVRLFDAREGTHSLRARAVVNAAGPWADRVAHAAGLHQARRLRLVKGSHIVLRRWFDIRHAYLLPNPDRRVVFVLPFGDRHVLVGTTDVEYQGDPGDVRPSTQEIDYLCASVGRFFAMRPEPRHVVWSYAGVRPLLDEGIAESASTLTRDWRLELDDAGGAPLLHVWGGKITTYRLLAEQAAARLAPALGCHAPGWTADAVLPGGDLHAALGRAHAGPTDFDEFEHLMRQRMAWLDPTALRRLARAYGTRLLHWAGDARRAADLGAELAPGVFEAELQYAVDHEWAGSAQDFLWRRSKCGLELAPRHAAAIEEWFAGNAPARAAIAEELA
ncbi:MAG: glycerol-3-phosphate dehydrogenase [Betaproteobacteria bacterium]|nr:glycerol-3-phosphate dehydrogenase [Betaproteobacteria bacterium]